MTRGISEKGFAHGANGRKRIDTLRQNPGGFQPRAADLRGGSREGSISRAPAHVAAFFRGSGGSEMEPPTIRLAEPAAAWPWAEDSNVGSFPSPHAILPRDSRRVRKGFAPKKRLNLANKPPSSILGAVNVYLAFIGAMNAIGVILLLGSMNDSFSDAILRKWTCILPADRPFRHSEYSRIWLWWAAVAGAFFVIVNFAATGWPPEVARVVIWADVFVYFAFELVAIGGSLSKNFGPGLHVAHVLWVGQAGWGLFAATR